MTRTSFSPGRLLRAEWSLAVVMLVLLAAMAVLPQRGLWMVDNENRFLQIRALADANFQEYALRWPGRALVSDYAMNPLRFNPDGTFEAFKAGQLISVFQPAYLVLGAVAWKLLGAVGLNLLPVIGAGFMLAGVGALARRLGLAPGARHLAVLLAGLATPALFYSQNLWEHTWAAACCTWGTAGIVAYSRDRADRRALILGCAGLAASFFFRDVLVLFAACLLGLLLLRAPGARMRTALVCAAVLGVGAVILVAFQGLVTGHPLGFHADTLRTGGDAGSHWARRPTIFYLYLVAAHPVRALSFALAAPFLVAFALRPRLSAARLAWVVPAWSLAAAAAGAAFLAGFLRAANPLQHLLGANSFFIAAPVLVLGLLRPAPARRDDAADARDLLLTSCCLYFLVYCLVAPWAGAISLHWGGRMQFCLYPLLAVLAAHTLGAWHAQAGRGAGAKAAPVVLLLLVSVAAQAYSLTLLREKKLYSEQLSLAMSRLQPTVVVTNVWWAGHEMYDTFSRRPIFYVRAQDELEALAPRLKARGIDRFILATRPRPGAPAPGVVRVEDGGWGFYSLDLQVADVR